MQNSNANPPQPRKLTPGLPSQAWRLLIALLEMPFRYLFGRDLFISYSRSDARKYAPALAITLQERMPKLSFYLDRWIAPPSGKLPLSLRLHLRWSSILVVVCTERAVGSAFVQNEVARFATLGRKVLTIDVEGAFSEVRGQEPWVSVSGADPEEEMCAAIAKGKPSENVIARILKMVEFTTQDRRLRRAVWATFAFVVLSVGGIGVYGYKANQDAKVANQNATQAEARAIKADGDAKNAEQRLAAAQQQEEAARKAEANARLREEDANKKAAAAEQLRVEAEKKTSEALEKERVATAEAQKQQNIARAQRLTAENNLAADPQSDEIEKKILFTVESMRRYPSREAYSNLVEGIRITPHPLKKPATHPHNVSEISFSPDGNYMATLSNGELWLHKADALTTGGEIGDPKSLTDGDERIISVAFSPDSAYLAALGKGGVRLWLTKTTKELAPIAGSAAALFGGGKNLIAVLDNKGDAATGEVVRIWRPEGEGVSEVASAKVTSNVSFITFIADSPSFVTLVNEDEEHTRFDFWHTTSGQSAADSIGPIASGKLSPNAKYYWSAGDTANGITLTLSKTDTREYVLADLRAVDFSPDGRFLVTTSFDPEYGELTETKVWDASGDSLKKLHSLGITRVHGISSGKFSPDGTRFAQLLRDNRVKVWNTLTGQLVAYLNYAGDSKGVAFTHDGQFMALATGTNVTLWPTGREWKSSEFVREQTTAWDSHKALSPDGKLMAFARGANVTILYTANGNPKATISMPCNVNRLSFMASERILTRGPCGVWALQIREGAQPERVANLPTSFDWAALSRDMKYAAVLSGDGPMVIDVANPSHVVQLRNDAAARTEDDEFVDDSYRTVAFSGDSKRVAAASRNRIVVWEWRTGRLLHVIEVKLRGSEDYNKGVSIAFDEDDNNTLVSADMYEAQVWNLSDSRVVGRVGLQEVGRSPNFFTVISPNGKFVASTLNVLASESQDKSSKTSVWQLRPTDVWKNACSRLQSGRLLDDDWKREFGTEQQHDTCGVWPSPRVVSRRSN